MGQMSPNQKLQMGQSEDERKFTSTDGKLATDETQSVHQSNLKARKVVNIVDENNNEIVFKDQFEEFKEDQLEQRSSLDSKSDIRGEKELTSKLDTSFKKKKRATIKKQSNLNLNASFKKSLKFKTPGKAIKIADSPMAKSKKDYDELEMFNTTKVNQPNPQPV